MASLTARPLAAGRISYLFIKVHNVDQMLAFYRDVLGFDVVYAETGVCAFLQLSAGGPQLAFYPGRDIGGTPSDAWLVAIDVDDIDQAAAQLAEAGVEVGSVHPVPYGRAARFTDPEGNRLQLHQPDQAT